MVRSFVPTSRDLRALVRLAIPIVSAQVGVMLMGVVDTIVVGHVSARELAAASLGNLYVFGLAVFAMGTLFSTDPIVAQAAGARDQEGVALGVQRGILIAVALGVVLTLLCLPAEPVFRWLRQPPQVVPRAAAFVWFSAPSMVPILIWATLRQSLQALKRTRAIVITIVAANLLNLALDWVLVFGHLGAPAMGAPGSALASTIARWVMLGLLLELSRRPLHGVLAPWRREALRREPLVRTFQLGLPIGIQSSVEFTTFASISVLAGWFGAQAIGGHQVAINLASLTFMVPLGVGNAASVLVGHAIGERDTPHARRVAASALACGAGFMTLSAVVLRAIPGVFAGLYTSVPEVAAIAATLIPIAGLFQVFDGLQVVAAGVLRGAGDTRATMVANVLGFWLLGMPASLWFGFGLKQGVVGLWWGFVVGLAAVAIVLVARVRVRLGGEVARVRVDGPAAAAAVEAAGSRDAGSSRID